MGLFSFNFLVAHTGFEPVISTLRGWCPRPLDDGDQVGDLDPRAKGQHIDLRLWRHKPRVRSLTQSVFSADAGKTAREQERQHNQAETEDKRRFVQQVKKLAYRA